MLRNPLQANPLDDYVSEIMVILATNPANGAALITALDTSETGALNMRDYRYKQALEAATKQRMPTSGKIASVAVTTAGADYVAGTSFPVTGAAVTADGGNSGVVRIDTVNGSGAILTASAVVSGAGYHPDGSIQSLTPVGDGLYGTDDVPAVTITVGGSGATATAVMGTSGVAIKVTIDTAGADYEADDVVTLSNGVTATINTVDGGGAVTAVTLLAAGTDVVDTLADPATGGAGTGGLFDVEAGFNVASITMTAVGSGYTTPTVEFDAADSANGTDESDPTPLVYTAALVDLTGAGDGNGVIAVTLADNDVEIINQALAALAV